MDYRLKSYDTATQFIEYDCRLIEPILGMKIRYNNCNNVWTIVNLNKAKNEMMLKRYDNDNNRYKQLIAVVDDIWQVVQ